MEAREILASELKQLTDARNDRDILSRFLALIPQDVLWETLRAKTVGDVQATRKRIEDAASVWIFEDEEDE